VIGVLIGRGAHWEGWWAADAVSIVPLPPLSIVVVRWRWGPHSTSPKTANSLLRTDISRPQPPKPRKLGLFLLVLIFKRSMALIRTLPSAGSQFRLVLQWNRGCLSAAIQSTANLIWTIAQLTPRSPRRRTRKSHNHSMHLDGGGL